VGRGSPDPSEPPGRAPGSADPASPPPSGEDPLEELRRQLADAPVEAVVGNHCYGLFELAALHLSHDPPNLDAARLAVDAMAALVEGLEGRLGEEEATLRDGLAQIRLAFVQVQGARRPPE